MRRNVTLFLLGAVMLAAGCTAGGAAGWTALPRQSVVAPSAAQSDPPSPTPALPGPSGSQGSDGGTVTVVARDLTFTPRQLAADNGSIMITLQNAGRVVHNLTIDELGVRVVVSPGRKDSVTLSAVPPGTYAFYCSVSGHRQAGMSGTLTVK
jgi:uncharacterized cupredoxin-like copper-binding protein